MLRFLKPRMLYAPSNGDAGGGTSDASTSGTTDTSKEDSSTTGDGKQTDGKQTDGGDKASDNNKEKFIPRERFDEVYNRNKELEKKFAESEAEKKKADEEDAKKRGDHEKIITDRDAEIASLKTQLSEKDKSATKLAEIANTQLDTFKEAYGEDALKEAKVLIGSDDPLVILEKLPVVEKYFKKDVKPTGGSSQNQGTGGDKSRLQQFQDRIEKGEFLSGRDREEYIKLINAK